MGKAMLKLSLAGIQSVAAPVLVPFTPAMLLGNEIFSVLEMRTGFYMALIAGISTALGLEFIGGSTCYAAVKLYRRRDWYALVLAIILVMVYVVAGAGSILYIDDSKARILAIFFLLTPVAYIAYALIHDLKEEDDHAAKIKLEEIAATEARVKELNAQARLVRAKNEAIIYPESFGNLPKVSETQTESLPKLPEWLPRRPKNLAEFRAMINDNTVILPVGLTCREVGEALGQSERTALNWLNEVGYKK